jgi:hypothetical protein
VQSIIHEITLDGRLTDWFARISADCPRRMRPSSGSINGARPAAQIDKLAVEVGGHANPSVSPIGWRTVATGSPFLSCELV